MPSPPTSLLKVDSLSNETAISVVWTRVTGNVLPILGYRLYVDSGRDDSYTMIYDGNNMPEVFTFTLVSSKLSTSLSYSFYVTSINFNGEPDPSVIKRFKPCTFPSSLKQPTLLDVTEAQIVKGWTMPEDNGGC